MKSNLVSVIMSVYNEEVNWLKESVESILNQSYKELEFIIIVDNPKNSQLIELLKDYKKKDKRVKLFINEKNMGLVYSLNRALSYANGEYIARMDADDISHLDRLQKQLNYLQNSDLDLIGANINLFNENGVFFTTDKLLTHKYIKKLLAKGTIGIVHPTFFAKKEFFMKLNGYCDAWHTEDKELIARAICHGFKVGNIKNVLLDCRYNNSSITKTNAIFVNKVGRYISEVFSNCLQNRKYNFDVNYQKRLQISQKEKDLYNKAQILKYSAREALKSKRYFKFLINMLKALYFSKEQVLGSLKVNIYMKLYKRLENFELKIGKL